MPSATAPLFRETSDESRAQEFRAYSFGYHEACHPSAFPARGGRRGRCAAALVLTAREGRGGELPEAPAADLHAEWRDPGRMVAAEHSQRDELGFEHDPPGARAVQKSPVVPQRRR